MKPCSGLGAIKPCEMRDRCANYVSWINDPRSQFNICTPTGVALRYFVPKDAPITKQDDAPGQASLF